MMQLFLRPALAAVAAAAWLAGCAAPPPGEPGARVVRYACDHGDEVEVTYRPPPRNSALLQRGAMEVELAPQPSGSGFVYSNGQHTLRGKGDELTVEIARMVPLRCFAR